MNDMYLFEENTEYIRKNRNHEHWNRAYHYFFPEMSYMKEIHEEDRRQNVGIDWILYLKDGTPYNIDEKVDRKGYPRFLIEIWQAHNKGYRGWALKEGQQTDYILYLVEPKRDYYLVPYQELKAVYLRNEQQWLNDAKMRRNGFFYSDVWNNTKDGEPWNTRGVCVPFDVLMHHIPAIRTWNPDRFE